MDSLSPADRHELPTAAEPVVGVAPVTPRPTDCAVTAV